MDSFWIALQFLTRLHIVSRDHWDMEDFGKSVSYFTIVGAIIGFLTTTVYILCLFAFNQNLAALFTVIFQFLFTGGLQADGFMDTSDGLFSGRERERKLEIMKDSCIGSNGVVAFVFLTFLKWQTIAYLQPFEAIAILFLLSIYSKWGMMLSLRLFPYARKQGMGKAFADYSPTNTVVVGTLSAILATVIVILIMPLETQFLIGILIFSYIFNTTLNSYCAKHLGGLTGDTYGFVAEGTEALLLCIYILCCSTSTNYLFRINEWLFLVLAFILAVVAYSYRSRVLAVLAAEKRERNC